MKAIKHARLTISTVCVSATLLLSACQPANEGTNATAKEDVAPIQNTETDTHAMDAHAGHDMAGEPMTEVHKAYNDSMTKMHDEMMAGMDVMHGDMMAGIADTNPNRAFARGMLSHHIGAVNMATVQLKYGKNEKMRKLAQEIIDAQQPEIEQMQNWLAQNKG